MTTVGGLPAHILLVHAVVALVPLTAVLLVLVGVWPAARRRLTWVTAVLAVVTLVSVPVTTEAGDWLEHRVERTALLRAHTELGDTMLPWAIAVAVVAVAILVRRLIADRGARSTSVAADGPGTTRAPSAGRRTPVAATGPGGRVVSLVLAVLAVVVAVGSVVTVYRVGDSGARAAWTGRFSEQAQPRPGPQPPG